MQKRQQGPELGLIKIYEVMIHSPFERGVASHSISAVSALPSGQYDLGGMGNAKVQKTQKTQNEGKYMGRKIYPNLSTSVRTLVTSYDRYVCLMGAE